MLGSGLYTRANKKLPGTYVNFNTNKTTSFNSSNGSYEEDVDSDIQSGTISRIISNGSILFIENAIVTQGNNNTISIGG